MNTRTFFSGRMKQWKKVHPCGFSQTYPFLGMTYFFVKIVRLDVMFAIRRKSIFEVMQFTLLFQTLLLVNLNIL